MSAPAGRGPIPRRDSVHSLLSLLHVQDNNNDKKSPRKKSTPRPPRPLYQHVNTQKISPRQPQHSPGCSAANLPPHTPPSANSHIPDILGYNQQQNGNCSCTLASHDDDHLDKNNKIAQEEEEYNQDEEDDDVDDDVDDSAVTPVVHGIDGSGTRHQARVTPDLEFIALSGIGLHTISLKPLLRCHSPHQNLREITLAANSLATIDLAPLSHCRALRILALNSNKLKVIDLTPLRPCTLLERLWLHDNLLEAVDLSPLDTATALSSLYLDDNAIHNVSVSLQPLAQARHLRSLRLAGNRLKGVLDVTPLLNIPALSQFHYSPGLKLVATGQPAMARVSPALRRCVLDITFSVPEVTSPLMSPAKLSTPPNLSSSPRISKSASSDACSPSGMSASPPFEGRTSSRLTPPCMDRFKHPPRSPLSPSTGDILVCSPKAGSVDARFAATGSKMNVVAGSASPCTPPILVAGPNCNSTNSALASPLANPITTCPQSSSASAVVVHALLVGFRRLARYAVEDSLARCGKISMRAIEAAAALADPSTILDSNIVVLHAPTEKILRRVCIVARTASVPVKVIGTERYRATNEQMLIDVLENKTSFFLDPLSPESAVVVFQDAMSSAFSKSNSSESVAAENRQDLSSGMPDSKQELVESRGPGCVKTETSDSIAEPSTNLSSPSPLLLTRTGTSPEDARTTNRKVNRLSLTLPSIELVMLDKPACSVWEEFSDRLAGKRDGSARSESPRIVAHVSVPPYLSLSPSKIDPSMVRHNTNKLRAERAAIEVLFHDLGGTVGVDEFGELARACSMPKCAGRLLFAAVAASVGAVEATSPETGVTGSEVRPLTTKKLSLALFMQYWEARLSPYDGDARLFNIIAEAQLCNLSLATPPSSFVAPDSGSKCNGTSSSLGEKVLNDLRRQRSAPPFLSPDSASLRRDRAVLRGCDAGIEILVADFMRGRSSRFGMFSLVKLKEAVAIGTALVLLALRGECGGRVGGCARPISAKDVLKGKLNSALIAAESGIFEGVASELSMDKLRAIKGNFASEADSDAIRAAEGCALHYTLHESDLERFNAQHRMLFPRGVQALMSVHCHGRSCMDIAEFSVFYAAASNMTSAASADYFFTVIDLDQNDYWSLADLRHFHSEKERDFADHKKAMSGIQEVWSCLSDMIQPGNSELGIARREFLRLPGKNRRVVIMSILFREDDFATLNIRKTMAMDGQRDGTCVNSSETV